MSNTLTIEIVKTTKLGTGEEWYGFNVYDQYHEAFCYEAQTQEEFLKMYPTLDSVLEKVLDLSAFSDVDMKVTNFHFDAPNWLPQGSIQDIQIIHKVLTQ